MVKGNKLLFLSIVIGLSAVWLLLFSIGNREVAATSLVSCDVPSSYTTIQSAVSNPVCDEVIIAAGVFTENIVITRSVTIRGAGSSLDATPTRLKGGLSGRVVSIPYDSSNNIVVQISDLNIEEGNVTGLSGLDAYGGGIFNAETLTVTNVYFINNFAEFGGALATYTYASTSLENSFFVMNVSYVNGDSIYNLAPLGFLTISNTVVSGGWSNTGIYSNGPTNIISSTIESHGGGGIFISAKNLTMENSSVNFNGKYGVTLSGVDSTPLVAKISNTTVLSNYCIGCIGDDGEGIEATANVHLTVDNSTIQANSKEGILTTYNLGYNPVLTVTNSLILSNGDGGIQANGDTTILDTQVLSNTHSFYGEGGIELGGGDNVIQRSEVRYNQGYVCGGGMRFTSGAFVQIRDTIIANNEGGSGVGLCLFSADVNLRRSTIAGNIGTGDGAGFYVGLFAQSSSIDLANSTISNNKADGDGGGIYALAGSVDLTNVTLARNKADFDNDSSGTGGGYFINTLQPVTFTLANTIVALNTLGSGSKSDCVGTVTSGGTNLIGVADGCTGFIGSDLTGTSGSPLDPLLGSLIHIGGHTPTIALLAGSPAIDAGQDGLCTVKPVNSVDQRIYTRVGVDGNQDGGTDGDPCDIGAYEYLAPIPNPLFLPLIFQP